MATRALQNTVGAAFFIASASKAKHLTLAGAILRLGKRYEWSVDGYLSLSGRLRCIRGAARGGAVDHPCVFSRNERT
jgi:hypothetical protein